MEGLAHLLWALSPSCGGCRWPPRPTPAREAASGEGSNGRRSYLHQLQQQRGKGTIRPENCDMGARICCPIAELSCTYAPSGVWKAAQATRIWQSVREPDRPYVSSVGRLATQRTCSVVTALPVHSLDGGAVVLRAQWTVT